MMLWGSLYKKPEYAIEKVEFSEFLIQITHTTGSEDRLDEVWASGDDVRSGHLRRSPFGGRRTLRSGHSMDRNGQYVCICNNGKELIAHRGCIKGI
jgi:hypothetical protein